MSKQEHASYKIAELTAGVRLTAGHDTILIISDAPVEEIDEDDDDAADGRDGHDGKDGDGESADGEHEGKEGEEGADGEGKDGEGEKKPEPGTEGGLPDAQYVIEVQLTAAGGTPLANESVKIVDPDSGAQIGEPGVTDENGVLRAGVPEQKEYHFYSVETGEEEGAEPWSDHDHEQMTPQDHSVLAICLIDAGGQPLAGESFEVKDADGTSHEAQTDDQGEVRLGLDAGVYTLVVRGKEFIAHTVFSGDLDGLPQPYKFSVG
jgi:hypothetical protein